MIKFYIVILLLVSPCLVNSQSWHIVGDGLTNQGDYAYITKIKTINNKLYTIGVFDYAGNVFVNNTAVWDGTKWDSIGSGIDLTGHSYYSITEYNQTILFAGSLQNIYLPTYIKNLAQWNGSQWSLFNNTVLLTPFSLGVYNNKLYVGGDFTEINFDNDTIQVRRIAEWDGTGWNNMGGGVTGGMGYVTAMTVFNNELIVAGNFYYGGTVLSPYIASWDGTNWHALGKGVNSIVFALEVDTVNNELYVGGNFLNADDTIPTKYIARWDGNKWRAVGNQTDNYHGINGIRALKVINNELYAGGMGNTGTLSDTLLSKWDGNQWYKISNIYNGDIHTLEEYGGNLYVGGNFSATDTGGNLIRGIACYGDSCPLVVNTLKITKEPIYLGNNIPNPTKGTTIIPYKLPEGKEGSIKVYSISGELKQECKLKQGSNQLEIDTLNWQKGTYIYSLFIEGRQVESRKMVVQ